jgi:sentrin-specific protease 1
LSVEAEEHKRRREREKAAKKFLKPLTAAQLEAVQDALRAPSTQILASGSFVGQGALDATGKDIATLKTGTWLNDEVANFAIGLLSQRAINSMPKGETQPKVHFFSTFFINKLYQDSNMYDYSNVRRWTLPKKLKYDVLRCEKIFVPIHQSVHWVLAEIDTRKKRISYYDSLLGESGVAVKNLKRWLIDEAKNKLNEDWDPDEWIEAYPKDIPLQKNGCDCGVFMIKYADYLSAGAELAFSQKHMEYFRRRLVWDIVSVGVR